MEHLNIVNSLNIKNKKNTQQTHTHKKDIIEENFKIFENSYGSKH